MQPVHRIYPAVNDISPMDIRLSVSHLREILLLPTPVTYRYPIVLRTKSLFRFPEKGKTQHLFFLFARTNGGMYPIKKNQFGCKICNAL